ncbi:MAG: cell division protein FtsZ [Flavobacteriales bacterium]|nr:cell division protein FtsZ [Flavobacteriales bacterium]
MEFDLPINSGSPIKVIGVGGGGSNAVNYMHQQGIKGVDFIVCNTDNQALAASNVPVRIQLGTTLTAGQGAGSIPEIGKNAAIENLDDVLSQLNDNTTMVFVTAGMGGGTGTGAAPVIAQACKDLDILTVGIVTVPFNFEGRRRATQAGDGLEAMRAAVDTLLVIRNDKLRELFGNLTLKQAFSNADEVLCTAAKGIAEVITLTGDINVDMNDVKTVMSESGAAIMGAGSASGEGRAMTAVTEALESPLLNDSDITGANFVLLNITYGTDEILMDEISEITDYIQDQAGATAEVIWGYGHDEALGEKICVTVIATGFEATAKLPEGPSIIKHNLQDEAREITQPMQSPMGTDGFGDNMATAPNQDDSPRLKGETAPTGETVDPRDVPLANTWAAEDATGEANESAPDLFGTVDGAEEMSLIHKEVEQAPIQETAEPALEATPLVGLTEDLESPVTAEAITEDTPASTGEYDILDLDADDEDNLIPEEQGGISFTNEQVAPEEGETAPIAEPAPTAQAQPVPTPRPQPKAPIAPKVTAPETSDLAQRIAQRQQSIEAYTKRLRTPSGLTELEDEPAYKRRNIQLEPTPSSNESQATRLSIDEETGGLKTDNPFLHDNVD